MPLDRSVAVAFASALALLASACDSPGSSTTVVVPDGFVARACVPGLTQECLCAGAVPGAQFCNSQGTAWAPCECVAPTPDVVADTGPTLDAAPDVVAQRKFYAVYIQDQWDGINCGSTTAANMSPGADIDAVELLSGTTILGTFDVVRGQTNPTKNTKCSNGFDDPNAAKGAPDATKNYENYFSLYDGWLIGEFGGAAEIMEGDTIRIYELGPGHPLSAEGADEAYEAYVATGLDCVDDVDPASNCMVQLSSGTVGTATLPVTGF